MLLYILGKAFCIIRKLFFWTILYVFRYLFIWKQLLSWRNKVHNLESVKPGFCGTEIVPGLMVHHNRRSKPPRVSVMRDRGEHHNIEWLLLTFWIFSLVRRMSVLGTLSAKAGESWILAVPFPLGECFSSYRTRHMLVYWVISNQSPQILLPASCFSQCFFDWEFFCMFYSRDQLNKKI